MIKINDIKSGSPQQIDNINKDNLNKKVGNKKFSKELAHLDELTVKEKLEYLLTKIDKQSEKLSAKVDIKELIVYKKLISEFLQESVSSMAKFTKDSFLDRRGRHRVHSLVKKVDSELEALTKDVLSKESDNINILKKMQDIRGLIVDIYM
ncbi:hypothetical protein Curi_c01130 [Gottschalkia acidurici 9a]|uniref:DUF327 domain-containing protein n=1 Tax=Gottschalkia acidurici (strain ATCC 7906 / DSM 604 / BCRC 14475 / CIP 104303 / KCTC 5404 / NCIMB 10678 / 9a) TaxID=1128398 RepID=K0ATL0_GOTA9|nr:YaaR family protein [Gottschalkia acidurici]AFS77193.1 hypothetical protein Curi_c01130 [Gottschalkia acidurici 9a]